MAQANVPKKKTEKNSYLYDGTDRAGKAIHGEILASSPLLAKAELRRQGITPKKIKVVKPPSKRRLQKVTPQDICNFSRQMATMMSAGVPLIQSFDIVAKGTDNKGVENLVNDLKREIESGRSFSESLTYHKEYFDDLFCNLVAAGETAGALDTMLDRIATYKEKTESLKRKIKKALFYPSAVLCIAIIVTGILLIFVVPKFQTLFKGFGADLPAFTMMVINLSNFVQAYWYIILGIIIGIGVALSKAKKKSVKFQHFLDRLILKLPVIGVILHKAAIARFARTLSTTFAAGVPLVEALNSVAGASGNIVYSSAITSIRDEVSTGTQMQTAMRNTQIFPNMVIQMVAIGEESGALDQMLSKVATIYEEEVDSAVDGLTSLLEPLIMAFLGVVVGGLVIAMYLPIFKLGSVV